MNKTLPDKVEAFILSNFKGLDQEIFYALNSRLRNYYYKRTVKELYIVCEMVKPGSSKILEKIISDYLKKESLPSKKDFEKEINAIIEIGKQFSKLDSREKRIVGNREIQQEFGHFTRIMGLDEILKSSKINRSSRSARTSCEDFSRFMMLVSEKKKKKSEPFSSRYDQIKLDSRILLQNSFGSLENQKLGINCLVACSRQKNRRATPGKVKELLIIFARLVCQYPLEIAAQLLDYYTYLRSTKNDYSLLATKEYFIGNQRYLKIISIGKNLLLILIPIKDNHYWKQLSQKVTNLALQKDHLGSTHANYHLVKSIQIGESDSLLLISGSATKILGKLSDQEIENVLNQPDSVGKINLKNNLQNFLTKHEVASQLFVGRTGNLKKQKSTILTRKYIRQRLNELLPKIKKNLNGVSFVSLEAAHIHADRQPGKSQSYGAMISSETEKIIKKINPQLRIERVLMVDEYHVDSRLNLKNYLGFLEKRGFKPERIILESDKTVLKLSLEILNYLKKSHPNLIKRNGGNLYLNLPKKKGVIELMEDYRNKKIVGCILFDAALSLYKLGVTRINGLNNHQKGGLVLNILENFYEPQQRKLSELLRLINYNCLFDVFFDEYYLNFQAYA